MLGEIAQSEASARARSMRLNDDLVVVVLARVLGSLVQRTTVKAPYPATLPLDPEMVRDLDAQLAALFGAVPRNFEMAALDALARSRLHVLTLADALDLDTLRLLGMLGPESTAAGALAHVDLLAAISSPAANDIVNFSLELLPSVLETHRAKATGTHAVHGYAGLGNKGSLDSLVLTELAWDEDEFARRMIENEILYYTREQAPDEARRLHYLLIDASASMRGDRQVFARGLSIALGKKLQLAGEEVWMRFFDSRLYDVQRSRPGQLPGGVPARLQGRARAQPGARLRAARDGARAPPRARSARSGRAPRSRTRRSTCRGRSCRRCAGRRTSSACSSCRAAASSISTTSICSRATRSSTTRRSREKTARAAAATKIVDRRREAERAREYSAAERAAARAARLDSTEPARAEIRALDRREAAKAHRLTFDGGRRRAFAWAAGASVDRAELSSRLRARSSRTRARSGNARGASCRARALS